MLVKMVVDLWWVCGGYVVGMLWSVFGLVDDKSVLVSLFVVSVVSVVGFYQTILKN